MEFDPDDFQELDQIVIEIAQFSEASFVFFMNNQLDENDAAAW